MNRVLAIALAIPLIGGCGGASPAPAPAPTREAKATTTPARLKPGERCPVTRRHRINKDVGAAAGAGPVYYIGLPRGPVTEITAPHTPDSGVRNSDWGAQKVMWVTHGVEGVVEIRGQRLDAPGEVRFGRDRVPADVLRLGWFERPEWAYEPSLVRLQGAGCYAYDIKAPGGVQETIVFRAAISRAY